MLARRLGAHTLRWGPSYNALVGVLGRNGITATMRYRQWAATCGDGGAGGRGSEDGKASCRTALQLPRALAQGNAQHDGTTK